MSNNEQGVKNDGLFLNKDNIRENEAALNDELLFRSS